MTEDLKKLETLSYVPGSASQEVNDKINPVIEPEIGAGKQEVADQHLEPIKTGCVVKSEEPNKKLMVIEEIEGLISQVNDRFNDIPIGSYIGSVERRRLIRQALEEIDLFQRTTLHELRKKFE